MKLIEPSYLRELADIRLNEEHWIQKINLIEFNDKNIPGTPQKGKTCWTRNYEKIPHWQRFNAITKWYKNEKFLEYSCKIVKNEVGEIELYTRNSFGEPAEIYWRGQDIIRKIRKKLAEEVRRKDQDLLSELKGYDSDEEIEFEPGPVLETPGAESSTSGGKGKEVEKPHKYKEQPERVEKPEISAKDEKLLRDYRKELKDLGKNASMSDEGLNDLINSKHTHLYYDEVDELRELKTKKDGLGTDQIQKTYDLGRPDLAILWRKQLYFIIDYQYVNNYKMYTWIRARKCKLAMYYWNWQGKTSGRGVITHAPNNFIKEPSKDLVESSRMHYEFCGELGIKRLYQSAFEWQPRFNLFQVISRSLLETETSEKSAYWSKKSDRVDGSSEGKGMEIPSSVRIIPLKDRNEANKALGTAGMDGMMTDLFKLGFIGVGYIMARIGKLLSSIATLGLSNLFGDPIKNVENEMGKKVIEILQRLLGMKTYFTVGPLEHAELNNGDSFYDKMWNKEEVLFEGKGGKNKENVGKAYKEWFKEQPHLWDHTTFQFYLFNNITMMGNGQFLGIQYKKDTDQFILPYTLFINHAPGVLVYRWEFRYITVKCEIKVMGAFQNNFNPMNVLTSISVIGCGIGLNARGWDTDPKSMRNELGADENAQQEQQGERTFKSTLFDSLNKSIEPSQFFGNTIDFHYSLGEFFCRLTDPIWFYRIELSELLYNNLKWCNNKSKILYLPLEWEDLIHWTQGREDYKDKDRNIKDTRKLGYWKWQGIKLQDDYDGFFTDIMTRGYWLDGGEDLKNPKLDYIQQKGFKELGSNAWDHFEAEEEYIEKEIKTIDQGEETVASGQTGNVGYAHSTFLRTTNPSQMGALKEVHGSNDDWSNAHGWCWGCFSHSINTHGGSGTEYNCRGTFKPTEDTGIEFFLMKNNTVDRQVAECKAGVEYKVKLIRTDTTIDIIFEWYGETTKIIRESVFKEKKTITQEVDLENLEMEGEYEGEIEPNEAELDENEVETEEAEGGEGVISEKDREREREREKEEEAEKEGEGEKEQEGEKEDETEKESEKEKEKEKEKEREKEKEKEKESESESEGESESEDEGEGENEA